MFYAPRPYTSFRYAVIAVALASLAGWLTVGSYSRSTSATRSSASATKPEANQPISAPVSYGGTRTFFLDPTLSWSTYLSNGGENQATGIAIANSGNIDVVGWSSQTWGLPLRPFSANFRDAFVAQLDSSGNVKWNTFLGGTGSGGCCPGDTVGQTLAVDALANIYITGNSGSTWGSPVSAFNANGAGNIVVAKLDSNGNLVWNTFLGSGSGSGDIGNGLALDNAGNIYLMGFSGDSWGSPIRSFSGGPDAFIAKLDSTGHLIWNTFLGGPGSNYGVAVAVDPNGNVVVAGHSSASWGSPIRDHSTQNGFNAFVATLDSNGNLIWNTFLGGGNDGLDTSGGLKLDSLGNIYVSGNSQESWGSPVSPFNGSPYDGFVAKLDSNGELLWNTFLGGSTNSAGECLALDQSGNIDVGGYSNGSWGSPAQPYVGGGGYDGYVAQLDTNGNLIWNTFLGGSGQSEANGLVVDGNGNIDLIGDNYPQTAGNAFVAQLMANLAPNCNPPVINCPANITLTASLGGTSSAVTYPTPIVTDNCPVTVRSSNPSGSSFPVGTTTVTITATNTASESASCSFTVTVLTPQGAVQQITNSVNSLVSQGVMNSGNGNALTSKLNAAISSMNGGNTTAACNQLQSFLNQTQAFINSGKLTSAQGQSLINAVNALKSALGC